MRKLCVVCVVCKAFAGANESLPSNNNGKVALMVKAKEVKVIQAIFSVIQRYESPHFKKKKEVETHPLEDFICPIDQTPTDACCKWGQEISHGKNHNKNHQC